MGEILGIARFTFHEGGFEEFERLSEQAMDIVRAKDTGTLQYDVFANADRSEAIVIERYRDSDALVEHGGHMAEITEQVLRTGTVEGEVLGEPTGALAAALADSPVRTFRPILSMSSPRPGGRLVGDDHA
jgi:quinol monooxygenase YgiN